MNLTSPDFQNGNLIPKQFTCNTTPPTLTIAIGEELKESVNSYAMFLLDIDAPKQKNTGMRGWCHWLMPYMSTDVLQISANNITELRESKQIIESYNSYGSRNYRGPCPPSGSGPHRYFFCLYALSASLVNQKIDSLAQLMNYLQSHPEQIVVKTELMGTFSVSH